MFVSSPGRIRRRHVKDLIKYLESKKTRSHTGPRVEGYLEHGPQALWIGSGSLRVGLKPNTVARSREATRLMMGFAPERVQGDDGQWHEVPLCADAGNENEWCAIDFTMGVPKSVSVLWAVSDKYTRHAIESAVTAATMAFVSHLEAFATPMRRRDPATGEVIHEKAAGLIAAAYRHDTSRPVGGETAPQLHDHILIAAVAPRVVK